MKYGFYSELAKKSGQCGTFWYKTPDGQEVEVTAVVSDDPNGNTYGWSDKVCLGQVESLVRVGEIPPYREFEEKYEDIDC